MLDGQSARLDSGTPAQDSGNPNADTTTSEDGTVTDGITADGSTVDRGTTAPDGPTTSDSPLPMDSPMSCADCASTYCSTQVLACENDASCACTLDCVRAGTGEGKCKKDCNLSGGDTIWGALSSCLNTSCLNAC